MHTFLKRGDDRYQIGLWLPNIEGRTSFMAIAEVENLMLALQAVNYLNGGDGDRNITLVNRIQNIDATFRQ